MDHNAYIRQETKVSMVINGVLSAVFFLLVFGQEAIIPVWGVENWVFDFLPQSFMITLMSTLVPGVLTAKRLKAGVVQPSAQVSRLPRSLLLRAFLLAVLAAAIGASLAAAITSVAGIHSLEWLPALVVKVLYGTILGALVTPIGLRAALGQVSASS